MSLSYKKEEFFFCLVCQDSKLWRIEAFNALNRVTSDCRPFPSGGDLFVCAKCGAVQKVPSVRWREEISEIYAEYNAYYQSGGEEQIVFDTNAKVHRRRSDIIFSNLKTTTTFPLRGRVLDVGCGNGASLISMSSTMPDWSFSGYELGDSTKARLARIPRFEKLHTGHLHDISEHFDLVTMIHSLEHFPSPASVLKDLLQIVGNGQLFIEVCNVEENPFDILIADHLIHFSPSSLKNLLLLSGFKIKTLATNWISKEISLLAYSQNHYFDDLTNLNAAKDDSDLIYQKINGYVRWLNQLRQLATDIATERYSFGLFGTSIAATWLASQLIEKIDFFVDEDINRIGRDHLGRPVISLVDIPKDAKVLIALAPNTALSVYERLTNTVQCALVMPPSLS